MVVFFILVTSLTQTDYYCRGFKVNPRIDLLASKQWVNSEFLWIYSCYCLSCCRWHCFLYSLQTWWVVPVMLNAQFCCYLFFIRHNGCVVWLKTLFKKVTLGLFGQILQLWCHLCSTDHNDGDKITMRSQLLVWSNQTCFPPWRGEDL